MSRPRPSLWSARSRQDDARPHRGGRDAGRPAHVVRPGAGPQGPDEQAASLFGHTQPVALARPLAQVAQPEQPVRVLGDAHQRDVRAGVGLGRVGRCDAVVTDITHRVAVGVVLRQQHAGEPHAGDATQLDVVRLVDQLTQLGGAELAADPDLDALFAVPTAALTLEVSAGLTPTGSVGAAPPRAGAGVGR